MAKIKAKDLIKIAENEVGYLEKKTNKNLDHKTKNAGYNNYTKYGKWYGALMGVGNPNPWCAFFVSWCMFEATKKDLTETKRLLGGNIFSYCPTGVNQFKNKKQWYTKNPEVGDIIFFHNNIRSHHTGIVYKVDNKNVYTIEGNTGAGSNTVIENGGGVFKRTYSLTNSRILGYGRPEYIIDTPTLSKPSKDWVLRLQKELNKLGCKDSSGKKLVEDGLIGARTKSACPAVRQGEKSNLVKLIQERLVQLKIDPNGVDSIFGTGMGKAIQELKRTYLGAKNPNTTIGSSTWSVLLGIYEK